MPGPQQQQQQTTTTKAAPPPKPARPPAQPAAAATPATGRVIQYLLIALAAVVGLVVIAAVVMILLSKPSPDPVAVSQAALEEATQKLRASNWPNLEGVTYADLESRILLLDAAIYATDGFAGAVGRLDRSDPENARLFLRRDAYVARGELWRLGRRKLEFLRNQFGHWMFDPVAVDVRWDKRTLAEQYVTLETEYQRAALRLRAMTQPAGALPPGPPFRPDLLEPELPPPSAPGTAPTTAPATSPAPAPSAK